MPKITVDDSDLDKLKAQMKAAPKAVRSQYRKGLKEVGNTIRDSAKAKIAERAPETAALIKVRTQMPATVIVQGGAKDHPVGKLFEGKDGKGGFWTHPLFGDENDKYVEKRQPHLFPAFEEHKDEALDKLKEHVTAALEEIDLHPSD